MGGWVAVAVEVGKHKEHLVLKCEIASRLMYDIDLYIYTFCVESNVRMLRGVDVLVRWVHMMIDLAAFSSLLQPSPALSSLLQPSPALFLSWVPP